MKMYVKYYTNIHVAVLTRAFETAYRVTGPQKNSDNLPTSRLSSLV